MKSLNTLIKLTKQELDALRRKLVNLDSQKQGLLTVIEALKKELAREIELASRQPEMSHFFGDFAQRIQKREDFIRIEIAKLDQKMEDLREEIRVKFGELKTFEIAKENHMSREKEKRARQEAAMLDEVALQQFIRKDKD